jgi:hypothetical protein
LVRAVLLSPIVLSSTLVWVLTVAVAVVASVKVRQSSVFNSFIAIASTLIWATVAPGVSLHVRYWPTVAFALLVAIFIFEVFAFGLIMLWKEYVLKGYQTE